MKTAGRQVSTRYTRQGIANCRRSAECCSRIAQRSIGGLTTSAGTKANVTEISRRRSLKCQAELYPFKKEDYHRCALQVASQVDVNGGPGTGHLIFLLEEDVKKNSDGTNGGLNASLYRNGQALLMRIGGDTLHSILLLLEGKSYAEKRPYALDLLWTVLERGQEISERNWKLLHVAVIALTGASYTARLFFGDAETGSIVWDCDSRPSDACWLALKTHCPIYMHKDVWSQYAQSLLDLIRSGNASNEQSPIEVSANSIRSSDPEPVKRLKREMEVAIAEEDYTTAARIRDHPYMKLFAQISELEKQDKKEEAEGLRAQLDKLIESIGDSKTRPSDK